MTLGATALPGLLLLASVAGAPLSLAAPPKPNPSPANAQASALEKQFNQTVRPFLQTFCVSCHGADKPQAQLDLASYATLASVVRDLPHWSLVLEKVGNKQMPPSDTPQPTPAQRAAVVAWIQAVRQREAQRTAGDPGPVLARRLSNAEYDYTIRDLTGVDLKPTREFPVDPANQEGFDNSGESLALSPALTKKYLQAAKEIADHLVLTTTALSSRPIRFWPKPTAISSVFFASSIFTAASRRIMQITSRPRGDTSTGPRWERPRQLWQVSPPTQK